MKSRLPIIALAVLTTVGVQAGDLRIVEVDWDVFRHYVAAHVWIADIDFRQGDVQAMHVCSGFNAFNHYRRDPAQMSRFGMPDASSSNVELQAAAFAVTMNSRSVMGEASGYISELRKSPDYKRRKGADRLEYARDFLWEQISIDPEVQAAIRATVVRLDETTRKLIDAGLVTTGAPPDSPFNYMLGMNSVLMDAETVDAILADGRFQAMEDGGARRRYFTEAFADRATAAAGIEDEKQRKSHRDSMRDDMDKLFGAGGSYVIRIRPATAEDGVTSVFSLPPS